MPQLRFDYTTNDWVVFAPLRKLRPQHEPDRATPDPQPLDRVAHCPFCPGNEGMTPHEILVDRSGTAGSGSAWSVRVVPNKFPALRIEEDVRRESTGPVFHFMGGCGAHEVVVESPHHAVPLCRLPVEQIHRVLRAVQSRVRDLFNDRRFQALIVFKNHGEGAGTSLVHPHWQVIATPVVPRLLRLKHAAATEHFDRNGDSLYQVLLDEELRDGARLVSVRDEFVAFVPYAAHVPFETWIMPRRPQASFAAADDRQLAALAEVLQSVLLRLYVGLENPDFNLTVDMAPRGDEDGASFRWHLRVLPRLTNPAGFELGSGMSINTTLPEEAAAFLRNGDLIDGAGPTAAR